MAKDTFYNLNEEKQDRIFKVLKDEFESKPFNEVTVKSIVEKLSIARGSFYQYFDDLEEAYFDVLYEETTDIHTLFIVSLQESSYNLTSTLDSYGKQVAEIIFDPKIYKLYKNKYSAWTRDMEVSWRAYRAYGDRVYYEALAKEKGAKIFALMVTLLGLGDSFHLIPRVMAHFSLQGFPGYTSLLSWGKFITSITMTIFYVLYYHYL